MPRLQSPQSLVARQHQAGQLPGRDAGIDGMPLQVVDDVPRRLPATGQAAQSVGDGGEQRVARKPRRPAILVRVARADFRER
ncbi:MAG: hypothetical protein KGJ94_05735 [Xanthomonadaceae bacterium]|nr:hypothetical protein [Xanthomonadaceae bacterium]